MPKEVRPISYQDLRQHMEQWQWRDAKTGVMVTGYNPPAGAKEVRQRPFYCRYITIKGVVEQGEMICLKVFTREHQRMVQFVASKQIRRIRDYLVMEVNGIRVVTH